ncbi:integrase core domain-containing protein [Sphingomonas sp. CFBP9021]|uniref:integrase core domain-containing protein n=1 Tax=unclassified Sphingomonas TaxID=196159 RepID=UPI0012E0CC89
MGKPKKNRFVGRFNSSLRDEYPNEHLFTTLLWRNGYRVMADGQQHCASAQQPCRVAARRVC